MTKRMSQENLLLVADTERDANMLFVTGFFVPDPFIFLRLRNRNRIVMNDLEIDRARSCARNFRVFSLSKYYQKLKKQGVESPDLGQVVLLILREERVRHLTVPGNFPIALARQLEASKIRLKVGRDPFFPERELKTADEVKKISAALIMAEVGLAEGIEALKRARIARDGRLHSSNSPLTAEKLRAVIDTAIIQAGGLASHTIVAGGKQGCDPHEQGHGPLRANQPIILDVFPRSQKTGYFGDITRTVVRGRASESVRSVYHTVQRGQEIAFDLARDGAQAAEVHRHVREFFDRQGYKTARRKGRMEGFFHGTGHGLGLEIHEAPRIGATSSDTLRAGHVVTVEPGLYYPDLGGGVRIEDVIFITKSRPKNLTQFEKVLEI